MIVLFVSECEKNAIKKTCRVLDAFANRAGRRTWKTVITMEGLSAVKTLLRKTASRNTSVSCHWIRRRNHSELLWVVGNPDKFNTQGEIPVNFTEKDIIRSQWENDWHFLPLIKALTALSALFHDWGKANQHFQNKLKNLSDDPIRHEWVSYMLINAFLQTSGNNTSDDQWLTSLAEGKLEKEKIIDFFKSHQNTANQNLPPMASLINWAVITHHKLPAPLKPENYRAHEGLKNIIALFKLISKEWGYKNREDQKELKFPKGLLENSSYWVKELQKWALKTKNCLPLLEECLSNGGWPVILHYTRLSLMLGDHFFSSQVANLNWKGLSKLYANTDKKLDKETKNHKPKMKQKLDEHLVGVMKEALCVAHLLPKVESQLPILTAHKTYMLKKKSGNQFRWQDKAVTAIKSWQEKTNVFKKENRYGFFGVNMASTGTGKTFANAKIMLSLLKNENGLRYTLALGLRTLTLQTGDEYRNRLKLDKNDVALQIGSKAIMELHEKNKQNIQTHTKQELEENIKQGSESLENLLQEEIDYDDNELEQTAFAISLKSKKQKKFFYSPILICTIDLIMSATETKRGGRYILPCLRLMSSDLVIDEIDDFNQEDLTAIGRLIFLTGMLGRKVILSSATISPDLAEGYFNAYQKGWLLFCKTRPASKKVGCAWIDEFGAKVENIIPPTDNQGISSTEMYRVQHKKFVEKRVKKLKAQPPRRKGEIIRMKNIDISQNKLSDKEKDCKPHIEKYFQYIKKAILNMHERHKFQDKKLQKSISIGLVRMANINPCINLSKYLIETDFPADTTIKIMTYHSRQILLLRSEQEKYLDDILKNREKSLEDPVIRGHIDNTSANNIIFVVISTPVEEVGRDHDFDWAVVEPSSLRSIIQIAGRVRRHREGAIHLANVAIMQYNLKAIQNNTSKPVYSQPGYENKQFKLTTHDLTKLLDEKEITEQINAIPRIQKSKNRINWQQNLAELEHKVIGNLLTNYTQTGPESLQGYIEQYWHLTALPQILSPFRKQQLEVMLYLVCDGDHFYFAEKDRQGKPVKRGNLYNITYNINKVDNIIQNSGRFWLKRDYKNCLNKLSETQQMDIKTVSLRYGELRLHTKYVSRDKKYLDQFGLVFDD